MQTNDDFIGTFSFDTVDQKHALNMLKKDTCCIFNTHENNHVQNKHLYHWISVAVDHKKNIWFYDSLNNT